MAKQVINMGLVMALNPEYTEALVKGEQWALDHARLCDSINKGEPEGFRRKFDGNPHKWCGGSCPFKEGCVSCTLPDDPEMSRLNREDRNRD